MGELPLIPGQLDVLQSALVQGRGLAIPAGHLVQGHHTTSRGWGAPEGDLGVSEGETGSIGGMEDPPARSILEETVRWPLLPSARLMSLARSPRAASLSRSSGISLAGLPSDCTRYSVVPLVPLPCRVSGGG